MKINGKRNLVFIPAILVVLWCAGGNILSHAQSPLTSRTNILSAAEKQNLIVFDAVWELINKRYYDSAFNNLDWQKSRKEFRPQAASATDERKLYATLNLMLRGLRDKHAYAVAPADVRREKARKNKHIGDGIGITGRLIENNFVITEVKPGSSAESAGIQTGWILKEWNGAPFEFSLFPTGRYSVAPGEKAQLGFLDESDRFKNVAVVASQYPFAFRRESKILKDAVLYLRFDEFVSGTTEWFVEQIEKSRDAEFLIVDLRTNGGGLIRELEHCLKILFEKEQNIGSMVKRESGGQIWKIGGSGKNAFRGGIFVLTDKSTGSAAEIFASAIQETKRGLIVGRQTAGAVLVVVREDLPAGGELSLSIRDYRTANGLRPEGQGIRPNAEVFLTLNNLRENQDVDLRKALELIEKITSNSIINQ